MFNNYINIHDFKRIVGTVKRHRNYSYLLHPFKKRSDRIEATWSKQAQTEKINWWNIPEVMQRKNIKITGSADCHYRDYVKSKYFRGKKNLTGLVLGCGAGQKTVAWAKMGVFEQIDGYDLSSVRIEQAEALARRNNVKHFVSFYCGDAQKVQGGCYDVIIVESALHHFAPLADVLDNILSLLDGQGIFVIDEYIGADRFQWPEQQLAAINGCLALLPKKYRATPDAKSYKELVSKPGRLLMQLSDPSEAQESSRILPLIHERFAVKEEKYYGGGILHPLMHGIAQNFLNDYSETKKWLESLFVIEDLLLESGEVNSDFVFGVYCVK